MVILDVKATGEHIGDMRRQKGITVRELQAMLGFTTPNAIYKWQAGKNLPTIDNMVTLAAIFGCSVDDMLIVRTDR